MKAMIFAAGLGTRLKPITDSIPKAMVKVAGRPLIQIVIQQLKKYGFNQIVVNVHHFADQIIDFLKANDNFGVDILISDERDQLLDTGGGLLKAKSFFENNAFLVHNVDVLTNLDLKELYNYHLNRKAIVTLAVRNRKTSRYFLFDDNMNLCGWKNFTTNETKIAKAPKSKLIPIAFSGIQIISPEIFSFMTSKGKFSITEVYLKLAPFHQISAYNHDYSIWMDLGKPKNITQAEQIIHEIL